VGTGYFDKVTTIIQGGASSVTALTGSTEEDSSDVFPLSGERVG
jgi:isocitrate lyase